MKKQAKRFDAGGDVADKIAGLAASNAEMERNPPSSMLDKIKQSLGRFGEGNIDDPKSEAYRKYGAGKAKSMRIADRMDAEANARGAPKEVLKKEELKKEVLKEVPFRGMPVKDSDALPSYLAKQANNPVAKPAITDVYREDGSPVYKKNEFNEVYMPLMGKQQKTYQDRRDLINANVNNPGYSAGMKKGGEVKKMASGGMASSASRRGDGIATKGKTRGKMC